jgi:hypothetical protein
MMGIKPARTPTTAVLAILMTSDFIESKPPELIELAIVRGSCAETSPIGRPDLDSDHEQAADLPRMHERIRVGMRKFP